MLDKDTLNRFVKEVNSGRNQFSVRMYSHNNFVKHQDFFNSNVVKGWFSKEKDLIKNSCKYKNFWTTTIPSLQYGRLLCVARLIDPPYFMGNKNKSRLSIYYILEQIDDIKLKSRLEKKLDKEKDFIKSIKKIRDNFLAHNNVGEIPKKVNAGVEDFFSKIDNIIKEIKKRYPHLKDCNSINLKYIGKLSKSGVEELFEKIT